MSTVRVGETEIYYEVHGDGPPLLLVSGLNGVLSYWKPMLADFMRNFKVVLHDHRGTGQSTRVPVSSVEQMASDALAVMDAAGLESAYYLGHSTGGAIGQILAIEHPERIRGLVLSSTWPKADAYFRRVLEVRKTLLNFPTPEIYVKASSFFTYPPWWISENSERLEKAEALAVRSFPGAKISASRIDAILSFDYLEQIQEIQAPTLVICAEDDVLTPAYFSKKLASTIPKAGLHLLKRGGHGAAITVQAEYMLPILSFLNELKQGHR